MKTQQLDHNEDYIFIHCPNCKDCEQHPIEEQRWHLQTYDIIIWEADTEEEHHASLMKCTGCKEDFIQLWNYNEETTPII